MELILKKSPGQYMSKRTENCLHFLWSRKFLISHGSVHIPIKLHRTPTLPIVTCILILFSKIIGIYKSFT